MLKTCVICSQPYNALRGAKTCSPTCSNALRDKKKARDVAAVKARRKANPERAQEQSRIQAQQWKQANPERSREIKTKWRETHREQHRAGNRSSARVSYAKEPEKHRQRSRTYYRANTETCLEFGRRWRAEHPERVYELSREYRARKEGAPGTHTKADVEDILTAQKHRCAYCRKKLRKGKMHVDHIKALRRGGTNDRRNLQMLCQPCNNRKHAKDPIDYAQSLGLLL
jgi:5-methylcytosine-specific restriction endonuclease McrA